MLVILAGLPGTGNSALARVAEVVPQMRYHCASSSVIIQYR